MICYLRLGILLSKEGFIFLDFVHQRKRAIVSFVRLEIVTSMNDAFNFYWLNLQTQAFKPTWLTINICVVYLSFLQGTPIFMSPKSNLSPACRLSWLCSCLRIYTLNEISNAPQAWFSCLFFFWLLLNFLRTIILNVFFGLICFVLFVLFFFGIACLESLSLFEI